MATIEVMTEDEVREEIEGVYESLSNSATEARADETAELKHVWAAIAEQRDAIEELYEKAGIEPPKWHEPIPFDA